MSELHAIVENTHRELACAVDAVKELTPEVARLVALKAIAFITAENMRNRQNVMEGGTAGDLANRPAGAPSKGKRTNGGAL